MECPKCKYEAVKSGKAIRKGGVKQRYQCRNCGYVFIEK